MSLQVSYKKQFLFGLILLFIIITMIEGVARISIDQNDSCIVGLPKSGIHQNYSKEFLKSLCYDYKSIIDYEEPYKHIEPNQHTNSVNINSFGIRGEGFDKEKDRDTYRIILLGGSAMYGVYATDDSKTIPGFLQARFNLDTELNVQVINAGINGADSFDETNYLKNTLLDFKPDMVIVYDGGNDLFNPIHGEEESSNLWPNDMERFFKKLRNYYKTPQFFEFIDRIIQKKIFNEQEIVQKQVSNNIDKKIQLWEKRWKEVCDIARERNINMIITLQPYMGTGNKQLTLWEMTIKENYQYMDVSNYFESLQNSLERLDNYCTETTDFSNAFDNQEITIFYDLIHVGDEGNKIIADKMFDLIYPIILEKDL